MWVAWAALTLASVLVPEAFADEWDLPVQKSPILVTCDNLKQTESTECKDICKEYGKNNPGREQYCTHLTTCDGRNVPECDDKECPGKAVCNDIKECETDQDCEELGNIFTTGVAKRKCEEKEKEAEGGKRCWFDGTIHPAQGGSR